MNLEKCIFPVVVFFWGGGSIAIVTRLIKLKLFLSNKQRRLIMVLFQILDTSAASTTSSTRAHDAIYRVYISLFVSFLTMTV